MSDSRKKTGSKDMNRRDFIGKVAVGSVAGSGCLIGIATLKTCLPSVLNEPPAEFKVGYPDNFNLNSVEFISDRMVYIVRSPEGIKAMSAICTHLGCIVQKAGTGYNCPCHGSKFNSDGKVTAGPAPRALDWLKITMASDGQLIVNSGVRVNKDTVYTI